MNFWLMREVREEEIKCVENHKFFDTSLNDFAGIDDALLVMPGLVADLKDYALILQLWRSGQSWPTLALVMRGMWEIIVLRWQLNHEMC